MQPRSDSTWDPVLGLPLFPFLHLLLLQLGFLLRAPWNGEVLSDLFCHHSSQIFFLLGVRLSNSDFSKKYPFHLIFKFIDMHIFMILFYPVNLYDSSSYVPSFTLNIFCFLFPGFQKVFCIILFKQVTLALLILFNSGFLSHQCLNFFPLLSSLLFPLFLASSFFFFFLFVVNFVIHWNEKALGSHVFPIPIPPPTLSNLSFTFSNVNI